MSIGTCSSESLVYPEGFVPLTPVYQLSSDLPLKKNYNLSIKHDAVIETKEDARRMTFCISELPRYKNEKIKFTFLSGGEFEVGGVHGNLSTRKTGLLSAGSMQVPSKISKKYIILQSNSYVYYMRSAILFCLIIQRSDIVCCSATKTRRVNQSMLP